MTVLFFLLCFLFWFCLSVCLSVCLFSCAEILTGLEDSHQGLGSKGIENQAKESGLDSGVDRECCGLL